MRDAYQRLTHEATSTSPRAASPERRLSLLPQQGVAAGGPVGHRHRLSTHPDSVRIQLVGREPDPSTPRSTCPKNELDDVLTSPPGQKILPGLSVAPVTGRVLTGTDPPPRLEH